MLSLSYVATLVISPLGSCFVGLLVAALLYRWRRGFGRSLAVFSLLWLYAWSTPWAAGQLSLALEWQHPPKPISDLPKADAAVVLGGGIGASGLVETGLVANLSPSADRVYFAAKLFHAGKVERLLVAGGNPLPLDHRVSEASLMHQLLLDLGVPNAAILLEATSENTQQNSENTAAMIAANGWQQVLLVTSARHMDRALGHFKQQSLTLIPAPSDYDALMLLAKPCCLPNASALAVSSQLFKEVLGQQLL